MSPEALALGVLGAGRAVPLAIVYAFLLDRHPRRLLVAYLAAGLTVSLGVGGLALLVFEPTAGSTEAGTGRLVVDLVVGVAALGAAAASRAGRFRRPEPARPAAGPFAALPPSLRARLRHPRVPAAALAGAMTNLPGVYYVAGLVAILATNPTPLGGAVQMVVYNLLRFSVPTLALGLVLLRPDRTADVVRAVHGWGVRHRRRLLTTALTVVGTYLVIKALAGLLG